MTKADLLALIDDTIKVSPDATDTDKLQGKRHRILLKALLDYVDGGGSAGDFPFDWQTPSNAFGGYYNNETTFKAGMVKFLHRDTGPSSSLYAENPERERGADPTVVLHYQVNQGSFPIKTIDVGNDHFVNPTVLSGTSQTLTQPNVDTNFQLVAYDSKNNGTSTNTQVIYKDRRFAFSTTTNLFGQSDAQVSAFVRTQSGELSQNRYFTSTVECNNSELYVAYPVSYGEGKMILNTFEDNSFVSKVISYTNAQGSTSNYLLYKSGNKLFGPYTISVQ